MAADRHVGRSWQTAQVDKDKEGTHIFKQYTACPNSTILAKLVTEQLLATINSVISVAYLFLKTTRDCFAILLPVVCPF